MQQWQVTSSHIHSLTYFNSNLYVWGQNDFLIVFAFNGTKFATAPTYTGKVQAIGHPGASLSISANGTSDGILWAATNSQGQGGGLGAWHATEPGILYAYGLPGVTAVWNNHQNATRDDSTTTPSLPLPRLRTAKSTCPASAPHKQPADKCASTASFNLQLICSRMALT